MRTVTIQKTYYKFEELSEEAQEKAIEKLWDLNVNCEWWDCIYDDAARIGLKITGFDLDRGGYCYGKLTTSAKDCTEKIIKDHGETCDTYILAQQFLADLAALGDEENDDFDLAAKEDLEIEFERALKEEYLSILRKEYEYLTSEEAIKETIAANEYEFDEEGNLV